MRSKRLFAIAFNRYVSSIKAGTASPYECLRFFERSFEYDDEDAPALIKMAALILIRHDPYHMITSPHAFELGLSEEEIQSCVSSWPQDDVETVAFLEGHLRIASTSVYHNPDLDQVARALACLEQAEPKFRDDRLFLDLRTEALRILGDDRYAESLDQLIAATPPEWRAHPLTQAMGEAVKRTDWAQYDALREQWRALPKNAHICECNVNFVSNIDGLRALERGELEQALELLRAAVSVNGCPHLNTGGANLRLAQELLKRGVALQQVAEHLDAVEKYCETEAVRTLRAQLRDLEVESA